MKVDIPLNKDTKPEKSKYIYFDLNEKCLY